jgi:hypothetical protein
VYPRVSTIRRTGRSSFHMFLDEELLDCLNDLILSLIRRSGLIRASDETMLPPIKLGGLNALVCNAGP